MNITKHPMRNFIYLYSLVFLSFIVLVTGRAALASDSQWAFLAVIGLLFFSSFFVIVIIRLYDIKEHTEYRRLELQEEKDEEDEEAKE